MTCMQVCACLMSAVYIAVNMLSLYIGLTGPQTVSRIRRVVGGLEVCELAGRVIGSDGFHVIPALAVP